jgi:pyruvate dehydrogenase E2 component (dihydrolipoamide acetyltransferase)
MATTVEMPKPGNTVEECLIARWMKRKGERVSAGEAVLEVETDKAIFEVTAPVDGTVLETFFDEGALVPVFSRLFVIGDPGEDPDAIRQQAAAAKALPAENVPPSEPTTVPSAPALVTSPAAHSPWSPKARRFAAEYDFHPPEVTGSGPRGRVLEEDLRNLYYSMPRVSPAEESQSLGDVKVPAGGTVGGGMVPSSDLAASPGQISSIRERIGRRMRESLSTTAQYTLSTSADAGGLLAVRARIKASADLPDININDLVAFCTVKALLQVPELNAEFIDNRIHRHSEIHLGFACDTPRGLIVPVVRDAQRLTISELTLKMKGLRGQAAQGTISADDLPGGTFTISNLGGLGIESFTPLLNPPQVAILGVGAIQLKPVRRQGRVEFIDAIGLSLTCDHQVIDGAPGARFLKVLAEKIEKVESLL